MVFYGPEKLKKKFGGLRPTFYFAEFIFIRLFI